MGDFVACTQITHIALNAVRIAVAMWKQASLGLVYFEQIGCRRCKRKSGQGVGWFVFDGQRLEFLGRAPHGSVGCVIAVGHWYL